MSRVYVALDMEMTGPKPESDDIIQIGAMKFNSDGVLDTWQTLVRPTVPVPYKVERLTGISQASVQGAPYLSAVKHRLLEFVGNLPIVGHSIDLDLNFLSCKGIAVNNARYDTYELSTLLLPQATVYSLQAVADLLGLKITISHQALDDADASRRVFLALLDRIEELSYEVVAEINQLTAGSRWDLGPLFRDVQHDMTRSGFGAALGNTVLRQLAARGMDETALGLIALAPPQRPEPIRPAADRKEVNAAELQAMLEEDGSLSRAFPGYEHRPQQIQMMLAVTGSLNKGEHALVEAGTGVGKSLAYLLPAVQFSVQNSRRVVVSTHTLNLQDQLYSKDIPALQKGLLEAGHAEAASFRSALIKGRSNYVCLRRWFALRRSTNLSPGESRGMIKVLLWLPNTQAGDRAELRLAEDEELVWGKVSSNRQTCLGQRCLYYRRGLCFFYRARAEAEGAHLVVVNHALLLSDLAADGQVLPDYEYLVIDEAHHLEDEATDQLGFCIDEDTILQVLDVISERNVQGRYLGLASDLAGMLPSMRLPDNKLRQADALVSQLKERVEHARERTGEFFLQFSHGIQGILSDTRGQYDRRLRLTGGVRAQPVWSEIEIGWDDLGAVLKDVEQGVTRVVSSFIELAEQAAPDGMDDLLIELNEQLRMLRELHERAGSVISEPGSEDVHWVSMSVDGSASLNSAPLHVGHLLEDYLFNAKDSVVLTSATLSVDGDFNYIKERLGLQSVNDLHLGSPFDYGSAAMLFIPEDLPEPGTPGYQRKLEDALVRLCIALDGQTLVLFTSHSALRTTYRAIQPALEGRGIALLGHGIDGSRRKLLEQFKSNPRTVLLGTSSFWEGVDVPGEALSAVVIAKLPFSVPSDPVFAARSEHFEDSFREYAVPQAVLRFKQGFGRLIRSQTDRGVAVVLDSRVITKTYGHIFLHSLPDCTVKTERLQMLPTLAAQWLGRTHK